MTLRLGIHATEFPPGTGGMEQHAKSLVAHAATRFDVTLVTWPGAISPTTHVEHVDRWTGFPEADRHLIADQRVDAWLILNAGWVSEIAAGAVSVPVFAYVHGNDFLAPWVPGLITPVARLARVEHKIGLSKSIESAVVARWWRQRRVVAGLRSAEKVFANSRYTAARCQAITALPAKRIAVVPPGIDERHFEGVARTSPRSALRLLTVTRLSSKNRRKNVEGIIRALELLEDVELRVVGDGDDRERLLQLVRHRKLANRVHFEGRLDDDALDKAYANSDLFVLAPHQSKSDVEGFGMVYIEAAARGLPVIATAVGGIPDAVDENINGIIAAGSSPEAIAAAIRQFQKRRDRFDPIAIRRFAERHSAAVTSKRLFDAIEEIVSSRDLASGGHQ